MKIKKIIDICKASRAITLFNAKDEQWISDGAAIYPLYSLPRFDEDCIYATYDIDDSLASKIYFREVASLPQEYNFNPYVDGDWEARRGKIGINYDGKYVIPYITSSGVVFVDSKYLVPFSDIAENTVQLCERYTAAGQLYFIARSGFSTLGLILPYDIITRDFVEDIRQLADECQFALHKKETPKDWDTNEEYEQQALSEDDEAE